MNRILVAAFVSALLPFTAYAFSAQWVPGTSTIEVANPTRATGYFGELSGEPQTFRVSAAQPIRLYVTLMQPQTSASKHDLSLAIVDPEHPAIPLGVILGPAATWTPAAYEGSDYVKAPDFRATLPAGVYELKLWSSNNDAPYVVVIGETETPIITRFFSALHALPQINAAFFGAPRLHMLAAPIILWPLVALLVIVALLIWWAAHRRATLSS